MEGTISMSAGELKLVPVKWIAQPGGYPWFSLNGRSEDGGRTFTGRVTDNPACTQFTLRRVTGTTTAR